MKRPEATGQALALLPSGEPFHWYVITLLTFVVYIPFFAVSMFCQD